MSRPPFILSVVRQNGKWVGVGDSLQAQPGFGGCVSWMQQASPSFFPPDRVVCVNQGLFGQVVGPVTDPTSMVANISSATAQFDATKNYNVATIWGGTNDILAGRTASQIYADITTCVTAYKAAGFKTMVLAMVRTNQGAGFQAARAALWTLVMANTAAADKAVDLDGIPGTPGDGLNYNVDGYHLRTPGQTSGMGFILSGYRPLVGLPP